MGSRKTKYILLADARLYPELVLEEGDEEMDVSSKRHIVDPSSSESKPLATKSDILAETKKSGEKIVKLKSAKKDKKSKIRVLKKWEKAKLDIVLKNGCLFCQDLCTEN